MLRINAASKPHCRQRQIKDVYRIVTVSFKMFVNFCQRTTNTSSRPTAKNSSPLSASRPYLRTAEANTSTKKRADPVAVELLHSSPFLSLELAMVHPPAVSSELVAQLHMLGLRHLVLIQLVHASEYLLHVHHPSALTALTTARRSHNTSLSIEAPLPLMSVNNSIAVYRVICLFQAHELRENSL